MSRYQYVTVVLTSIAWNIRLLAHPVHDHSNYPHVPFDMLFAVTFHFEICFSVSFCLSFYRCLPWFFSSFVFITTVDVASSVQLVPPCFYGWVIINKVSVKLRVFFNFFLSWSFYGVNGVNKAECENLWFWIYQKVTKQNTVYIHPQHFYDILS